MSGIILLILRAGMAITLYAFLGWGLWLLWRDLKHQQTSLTYQQVAPLIMKVAIGDTRRVQHFTAMEITIGRDPGCECVIDSKTVSTRHAQLCFERGQWWVEDLESTNGTLLNQEPVTAPTVLTPGDQLRCGEATLTIEQQKTVLNDLLHAAATNHSGKINHYHDLFWLIRNSYSVSTFNLYNSSD